MIKQAASGLLAGIVVCASATAELEPHKQQRSAIKATNHHVPAHQLVFSNARKVQPELRAKLAALFADRAAGKLTKSREQELFPVIINLDAGDYADRQNYRQAFKQSSALASMRGQIRRAQNRAIAKLAPGAASRVRIKYDNLFAFSADLTADEIARAAELGAVEYIEERPLFHLMDSEAHALTGIDQTQVQGHTGQGSVIAIIDDGIDHDHPAFGGQTSFPNSKILGGWDFADNDSDPRIDCLDQSHGTAVAGVAAGNGGGVVGSAPDAQLVFLKVQKQSECGQPSLSGDVAAAIDWAVTNQATYDIDIISMSLGGGSFSSQCVDRLSQRRRCGLRIGHDRARGVRQRWSLR